MSYRIAYKHAAISFPAEILNASLPDGIAHFYEPQYFLLELGGDNNLYESTFGGGCGRRVRSWCALGCGMDWEVMQEVVRFSAACESGCLKFYGKGDITPECYIRRGRNTLAGAIQFDVPAANRYRLSARLQLTEDKPWDKATKDLNTFLGVNHDEKLGQYWDFNLMKPDHAALFIMYARSVDKSSRNWLIKVSAPE